jgi:hypothetical protein
MTAKTFERLKELGVIHRDAEYSDQPEPAFGSPKSNTREHTTGHEIAFISKLAKRGDPKAIAALRGMLLRFDTRVWDKGVDPAAIKAALIEALEGKE